MIPRVKDFIAQLLKVLEIHYAQRFGDGFAPGIDNGVDVGEFFEWHTGAELLSQSSVLTA